MKGNINVVIGSWGSYNACNERALGSSWLDFSDYSDWEEIEEQLKKEGFELNGIDEELFIQDIEGIPSNSCNWDYISPKKLFNTLIDADVLTDEYKFNVMQAFLEIRSFGEFKDLVNSKGSRWDDDIHMYQGFSWEDYGREMFENSCYNLDERLQDFFDFEAYGQYVGCDAEEYSKGIVEIY